MRAVLINIGIILAIALAYYIDFSAGLPQSTLSGVHSFW